MPTGDSRQYNTGRSRILSYSPGSPAVGTNTNVHAAVTDNGSQQVVTTAITNPDVPRTVSATAGGTATDIKAIQVTVAGTNIWGQAITEVLPAFTVDTAGTVNGSKAFATVTSITIPAHDGTGATTSVGTGTSTNALIGLPVCLSRKSFIALYFNGTSEAIAASNVSSTNVESNTFRCTSTLNGSPVIIDYYNT